MLCAEMSQKSIWSAGWRGKFRLSVSQHVHRVFALLNAVWNVTGYLNDSDGGRFCLSYQSLLLKKNPIHGSSESNP
jgi:hypothetical protein